MGPESGEVVTAYRVLSTEYTVPGTRHQGHRLRLDSLLIVVMSLFACLSIVRGPWSESCGKRLSADDVIGGFTPLARHNGQRTTDEPALAEAGGPPSRIPHPAPHIGRRLQQELDTPVNIVRSRSTLRDVVMRIRELHQIALLVDRRIDPDQTIDVQFVQTTLADGLEHLAAQLDARLVTIGGTLFIGPPDSTDRIRTLIALRTAELRDIGSIPDAVRIRDAGVRKLLKGTTIRWDDLKEPVEILGDVTESFPIDALNSEAVPHDLWGQGVMADVNAVEALSLLLGQFDLTFQWQPGRVDESIPDAQSIRDAGAGRAVRIIPAPDDVVIERSHPVRQMSVEEAIELIRDSWPHRHPTADGRAIRLAATAGEHDDVAELLNPSIPGAHSIRDASEPDASEPASQGPLKNRRFTLTTTRAEAIAVLRTLQLQGVTVEYEKQALKQAGIDLRQKLTLKLNQATADEFFTAICEPLGLTYELDGTTVRLKPK